MIEGLVSRLPARLRRPLYRLGYVAVMAYRMFRRPRTRGVKCVIVRGEEILLVRHTYGDRRRWELPGGGIKRGEEPLAAARREVREELGVEITDWRSIGRVDGRSLVGSQRLFCFFTRVTQLQAQLDPGEIAEARWFTRNDLPRRTGYLVRRVVTRTPA